MQWGKYKKGGRKKERERERERERKRISSTPHLVPYKRNVPLVKEKVKVGCGINNTLSKKALFRTNQKAILFALKHIFDKLVLFTLLNS